MADSDDDKMLTPQNRIRRAQGNSVMDVMAIMRGRGNAVGEMSDESEKRNYAPAAPDPDDSPKGSNADRLYSKKVVKRG